MLTLRYEHRLPADHAMEKVRERVATRGRLWDAAEGLVFKAFAVRSRGTAGATANSYASFYLWHDAASAMDMLADRGRFGAVIDAFGRPRVETALPLVALTRGDATQVRSLLFEEIALDADVDPATLRQAQGKRAEEAIGDPGTLAVVSSLDPSTWRLSRMVLVRTSLEAARGVTAYEVVHLSHPGWARLAGGRPCR